MKPASRGDEHLYFIQPHERKYLHAGQTSDRRQVLMCLCCAKLVCISFDQPGNLLRVEQRPLDFMVEEVARDRGTPVSDERIDVELAAWQKALGFVPATIAVKKFFVMGRTSWRGDGIGIEDYPAHWLEAVENPEGCSEEELTAAQEGLSRWQREGLFVLWWGNDFWFDGTGSCVAS
jgi:hypothetical protein